MALAETANLVVKLSLGGNFVSQIGKATSGLGKLEKGSTRAYKAGAQIGTGIKNAGKIAAVGVGLLATQVALGLDSLVKLEGMTAQTEAVLKSTGGVAGVTAEQVRVLAEEFESMNAVVGDELIQNAENLLLTFPKITKRAFKPALAAALDMNQALGGGPEGLAGVAKLLGKALQDPEKGLSRLGRAVGGFSDETVKAVKAALKNNDTLGAQNIILAELERRYGGSFARAGKTTGAAVAKFGDAIEDLQRSLATALLPTVRNVADALTDFLADPEVVQGAKDLGVAIAGVFTKDKIKGGIAALGSVVSTIRGAMPAIVSAAQAIGSVVGTAVNLFNTLPPELKTLLVAGVGVNKLTDGLVTNVAGGIVGAILGQLKSAHVSVTGAVVQVNGPVAGVPGAGVPGGAGAAAGGGLLATAGAVAVPVTIAAIGAQAATTLANASLTEKGIPQKFETPGSGVLPFGIESSLNNIASALKIIQGQKTPEAVKEASKTDSRATLQVEQATKRSQVALAAASAKVNTAVENMKSKLATELTGTTNAERETKREAAKGAAFGSQGVSATKTGAATVAAAVRASRPITYVNVNVTANSYSRTVTVNSRYGSGSPSRTKQDQFREFG